MKMKSRILNKTSKVKANALKIELQISKFKVQVSLNQMEKTKLITYLNNSRFRFFPFNEGDEKFIYLYPNRSNLQSTV